MRQARNTAINRGAAATSASIEPNRRPLRPTPNQIRWLQRGLDQPGGKLPLFDDTGNLIAARTILSCIAQGWAVRWVENPVMPDWLVCKLTASGRELAEASPRPRTDATPGGP
jgi:hypothetical protein